MLQLSNIDVFHGDLQALWGVSLQVGEGKLVSLIGANGAGKTTIVESIAGLLTAARASISSTVPGLTRSLLTKSLRWGSVLIPEDKGIFRG